MHTRNVRSSRCDDRDAKRRFHDLRCYEEHWLEYFASRGYEATAITLRSGRSKLSDHVKDVVEFMSDENFVVAHSFGGPVAMEAAREREFGLGLVCSVPPSGNSKMVWRTMRRSLGDAWLITKGFAMKAAARDESVARKLFFDDSLDDNLLKKYVGWFSENSKSSLDLADFQKNLPQRSPISVRDCVVMGADKDAIVDVEGVRETADFLQGEMVILEGLPHDVMLGERWREGADVLLDYFTNTKKKTTTNN